jgi:hypothetical protein
VIHISQLKKAIPPSTEVSSDESLCCIDYVDAVFPAEVTETKLCKLGASASPYGLIKWTGLPDNWAT